MRQNFLALGVLSLLLLAGAGCSPMENTTENKPAENTQTEGTTTPSETPEKNTAVTSIELTGQALGNQMAQFSWKLPEGATDPAAFRLVRGQNENPTQPPGYWYAQPGKSRGTVWVKLPKGEQHFRVCVYENDACGLYSNDVVVHVK